ncbi:MAG: roadblock/LC7 domain-containing protein [Methylococcaceae bacterium]
MRNILLDLNNTSTGIEASAIISNDGLVIASALTENMNEDTVGSMSAALYSVGSRSAQMLAGGILEQITIQGSEGHILITKAGKEAMLAVITKTHTGFDHIFEELKLAAEKIIAII